MSNKKFRPVAQQRPESQGQAHQNRKHAPQDDAEVQEMIAKLSSFVGDTFQQAGVQAEATLTRCFPVGDDADPLSDDSVRTMLGDCLKMMWQSVRMASEVLGCISVSQLRQILAGELKLPDVMRKALTAAGVDPAVFETPAPAPTATGKPQQRPRGAKHPVLVMVQAGIQCVKLIERITRATNPGVYNLRPKRQA